MQKTTDIRPFFRVFMSALISLSLTNMSLGQIEFSTTNFSEVFTKTNRIDLKEVKDLGIKTPIDEAFMKYDKVSFSLMRKSSSSESFHAAKGFYGYPIECYYYPNSKSFEDRFGDNTNFELYLIVPDEKADVADICKLGGQELYKELYSYQSEFKVIVKGYFADGTKSIRDENTESYTTVTNYVYSKTIYESEEYSFLKDENRVQKSEDIENSRLNRNAIRQDYLQGTEVPFAGYVQPKKAIYEAYELYRTYCFEIDDFSTLLLVEEKLIALGDAKTNKLKAKLKEKTDPEEIKKIILDY